MKRAFTLVIWVAIFLVSACKEDLHEVEVSFDIPGGMPTRMLRVETAVNMGERRKGLMYRRELRQDGGMLFVFPDCSVRTFWMHNTFIPLDMIFIDEEMRVVTIAEFVRANSDLTTSSVVPAKYVLELNAGMSRQLGIVKGSRLVVNEMLRKAR